MVDDAPVVTEQPVKSRLGKKSRTAIELMVSEGLSAHAAADRCEIRRDTLTRALKSRGGASLYTQLVKDVRANAGQAAYLRMNHLSETAKNERNKMDANKWVAGVDGISPVQKVQGQYQHSHTFGGFEFEPPDTIEGTVTDTQSGDADE